MLFGVKELGQIASTKKEQVNVVNEDMFYDIVICWAKAYVITPQSLPNNNVF